MLVLRVRRVLCHVLMVIAAAVTAVEAAPYESRFDAPRRAEVLARVTVDCATCDWSVAGREAVMLVVTFDGRYVQHIPVLRTGRADYHVLLGSVEAGPHTLRIEEDGELTARDLKGDQATIAQVTLSQITDSMSVYRALALAPIIYARPNTVGRFTDVPVFMWYEVEATDRGTRYRYSVIFTNEDGGTPADRLMATWGRTTDIEYLYSVEIDASDTILSEDIQGPDHEVLPYRGAREGRHPLLWVVTDNNMVLDKGTTKVRYAPAPVAFPLPGVSREEVMDTNPWLYATMAHELAREGKIVPDAPPQQGTIPDPRRFMFVEACGEVGDTALMFAVQVGRRWISSDRGVTDYRITRDGCFRVAIPLSQEHTADDVRAIRVQAFARNGQTGSRPAHLTRINKLFMLDEQFKPGQSLLIWLGSSELPAGGPPLEIALK